MQRIGGLRSHNLFANLYIDFTNDSRFTPYVGFGVGFGRTDLEYDAAFARNDDPCAIRTGSDSSTCPAIHAGSPNDIQRNLAGTTTTESEELDDATFGYQILFGVDYELTETLLVGLKGRWVRYDAFRDGDNGISCAATHPIFAKTAASRWNTNSNLTTTRCLASA